MEGRFPNLDEIPSRLLVWAVLDEGELLQDSTDVSQLSSRGAPQNAAAANDEEDNLDEEWAETIEGDVLSGVTNPRRPRNPSDIYQSAHPEQTRRVMVSDGASEDDVVMTALRESVDSAFRGTVPLDDQRQSVVRASLAFSFNVALTELLEPFEHCRLLDNFIYYSCAYLLPGFSCRVAKLVLMKKAIANVDSVSFISD
ncbi:unnamed protein product [Heligmosomoides polygyrus]|uniref:DDE_Tnp_1_7 domain-containing protein n=1 Tax=Heligmosomoides polygyrus TaxID=6339 RepID=A0A3P8G191_HELPZ|nr:unnamed protein product [Heligmosomoides polygyrus]